MNSNFLTATNILVALNILMYFGTRSVFPQGHSGLALYFFENPQFSPWQFITYLFMHGSVPHLIFNMIALWMFGQWLERLWGSRRFLFFYFVTGIGAAAIYMAINHYKLDGLIETINQAGMPLEQIRLMLADGKYTPAIPATADAAAIFNTPMVGASGAIYGILVAFAWMFPNFKMALIFFPVPIAAKYFVPALLALDLFSGVTGFSLFGGNVAHFAHIGGAVIGALLMWWWRDSNPELLQRFK